MRVSGMSTIPLQELRHRLVQAMAGLPSNASLEEDPLSPDVMRWVGDVSALLSATGNVIFMGESQVAINGLNNSKTRVANFHKLRMILQKALSETELNIDLTGTEAQSMKPPSPVTVLTISDDGGLTSTDETGAVRLQGVGAMGLAGDESHPGRFQGIGARGAAAGEGLAQGRPSGPTDTANAPAAPTTPKLYQAQAVEFASGREDRQVELHQVLMTRVAVLEAAIQEIRRPHASIGIGHNQPPPDETALVPLTPDDVDEIDRLIAQLKDQPPAPAVVSAQLIQQSHDVSRIRAKAAQIVDTFINEAVKAAGQEVGKRLVQVPFWLGVIAAIQGLTEALQQWVSVLPH